MQPSSGDAASGSDPECGDFCSCHPLPPSLLLLPALCGAVFSSFFHWHTNPPHTASIEDTLPPSLPLYLPCSSRFSSPLASRYILATRHCSSCCTSFSAALSLSISSHAHCRLDLTPNIIHHQKRRLVLVQMSMLEHFHWQPLSFLIGKWDDLDSVVGTLNNNQCEMIRATPSFRKSEKLMFFHVSVYIYCTCLILKGM